MRGDIGLARNSDGLNADETVGRLGLDYEHNPHGEHAGVDRQGQFTDQTKTGEVSVATEVKKNGLHYIEQPMSASQADKAQVPLAHDLYELAQSESANPDRFVETPRKGGQDNPYTGTGATAPNNLEGFEAAINQELKAGEHALVEGAQLKVRGATAGADQVVATYQNVDGKLEWVLSPELPPEKAAYYQGLIDEAEARASAAHAAKVKKAG
jgi:hypothetical protein